MVIHVELESVYGSEESLVRHVEPACGSSIILFNMRLRGHADQGQILPRVPMLHILTIFCCVAIRAGCLID